MARRKNPELDILTRRLASPDEREIDQLYGLQPRPAPTKPRAGTPAGRFVAASGPYRGERFEARIELRAGAQEYIEDCQVCCRPMALSIEVEESGALRGLRGQRMD